MSADARSNDGGGCLILVRHTEVDQRFSGVCYGQSDVTLSEGGQVHAKELAIELASEKPAIVLHSGLSRARFLAEQLAGHVGVEASRDERLREMNFGRWELQTWDDIFEDVGHGMSRLISEPETYCAPEGETAYQVRDRMVSWARSLPGDQTIVAVGHGGAISALRGVIARVDSPAWPGLMPKFGELLRVRLPFEV